MRKKEAAMNEKRDEKAIDMRACKQEARRLLPAGNPVREALSMEQDFLPRKEGLAKLETYVRFLMAAHYV